MERKLNYSSRVAFVLSLQETRAAAARKSQIDKEATILKEQYWVRFKDITIDDINAIFGIYERLTGYSPSPITEQDFDKFRKEFISDYGFSEFPIEAGSKLEMNRRMSDMGVLYVRPKICGGYKILPEKGRVKNVMQDEIDKYFSSDGRAILLKDTYKS